jgi:hypothetical protein
MSYERFTEQMNDLRTINGLRPPDDYQENPYAYYNVDMLFPGRYRDIARSFASSFRAKATTSQHPRLIELASDTNVQLGFSVLCQTLSLAPDAYNEYTQQKRKEKSVEQLSRILQRSGRHLVAYFADVSVNVSKIRELEFGIYDRNLPNPYEIIDRETGAELVPISDAIDRANMVALTAMMDGRLNEEEVLDKGRRCPALGRVLFSHWDEAIYICANNPALFAADLGLNQ